jgi:pimeloyl-ACP methyl ester carboxylesterase
MAVKKIIFKDSDFLINYEILHPNNKNSIIFLHGWGSNKEIMKQAFGTYFKDYKHIYIDMPGFGKSTSDIVLTTFDYGDIIKNFLVKLNIIPSIVVGHSFGGKVATLQKPKNLVLLSSAGIVEEKDSKTLLTIRVAKIFNKFGLKKVTKLLRSDDVNTMSENMYETFKNVVDEKFNDEFKKYRGNAMILWGTQDTATSLDSGKLIHSLMRHSKFKAYNDDHYFFLRNAENIEMRILNYVST